MTSIVPARHKEKPEAKRPPTSLAVKQRKQARTAKPAVDIFNHVKSYAVETDSPST